MERVEEALSTPSGNMAPPPLPPHPLYWELPEPEELDGGVSETRDDTASNSSWSCVSRASQDTAPCGSDLKIGLRDLDHWLQQQLEQAERSSQTIIEDLSCEGNVNRRNFESLLESEQLPGKVVDKLVELLTKEEIRSSMMRGNTNRIYGLVMRPHFLARLQSQIEWQVKPTPVKMHMYVRLVQELMWRTSDGWKEVGNLLDAIKRAMDSGTLSSARGPATDDLLEDLNCLLDQRDKLERLRSGAASIGNYSWQEEAAFLRLPILPCHAEMVPVTPDTFSRPLTANRVGERYSNVLEYLKTHFQLLREDYIESLKQGITAFKIQKEETGYSPDSEEERQDLNMYFDVRFLPGIRFNLNAKGILRQVKFRVHGGKQIYWERSNRLLHGSLLCVSEDDFQTFSWAQVVNREEIASGSVTVRLVTESDFRDTANSEVESAEPSEPTTGSLRWFDHDRMRSQRFIMAETPAALLAVYANVLTSLRRQDMCRQLAFKKHLIDLEPEVGPPSYLERRPQRAKFNFGTVFPNLLSGDPDSFEFDILTSWPEWKNCALDDTQRKALKHGLTKELALIQEPLGTGKTYVGLLLVKALLANLKSQEYEQDTVHNQQDVPGPILVVCATHDMLDQFLLGICEFEKNLIRVGRSERVHPGLKTFTLEHTMKDQGHSRASEAAWKEKTQPLQSRIEEKVANRSGSSDELERLSVDHKEACMQALRVANKIKLAVLRQAKVVGMTTGAGAGLHDLLVSLGPTIVVVEKANEVLESHVLACLSPHTKHLILIGDEQHLRRPLVATELALNNKLGVSLFERLVSSGVEVAQGRTRTSISQLIRSLNPELNDHESVRQYEDVRGVKNKVFLLRHKAQESSSTTSETGSKVNKEEAAMVVEFCLYLLNQSCYTPADINILSMYEGQVQEIRSLLHTRMEARSRRYQIIAAKAKEAGESEEKPAILGTFPKVSTVEAFQGEEGNIILLSLVRSDSSEDNDGAGKISFLNLPNRACIGLYMFGNEEVLRASCVLWENVIQTLDESMSMGSHLTLCCQNHREKETTVERAKDFKQVKDGGCSRPCEFKLPCGHDCPRRCHPGNHVTVACKWPCFRPYETCEHICTQGCHAGSADCPPCMKCIPTNLPEHGHEEVVACSEPEDKDLCKERCTVS